MNALLGSVSYAAMSSGGPPPAPVLNLISARYWRINNLVYNTSGTQINGLTFGTGESLAATLNPVSITNDTGDVTATFNKTVQTNPRPALSLANIDAVTFFDFDFGEPVTPTVFSIWGHEWDTDNIVSFNMSYSSDGTNWTLLLTSFATDFFTKWSGVSTDSVEIKLRIIPPTNGTFVSNAHQNVILGRRSNAVFLT
ncbi:hypothetical protein [Silicibacter phage DSS3phi2]|uniref:F5/8 type C domain-containing protein n=1 Tax=Silicibacter phage DSS3phi2 TaxID=490912 RepID=C4NT38_9CAUD|nr:hypothetical protein DSS3P2_gp36 [Silicibacter phage DSS3phi2]ACL81304.1 hypothetical protein [Silicibacter phage DSS3phi2]